MSSQLDKIKAAFAKNDNKGTGNSRPNNYYPFWDMKEGDSAVIRFLPDLNQDNPLGFMIEKSSHSLTINGEKKTIACRKMHGDDCAICKVSSAYYKENDKVNGQKYWRKKQHLAQALIIEDPLQPNESGETHEGKVRFIAIGFQLFNVIKEALQSGDFDDVPYSFSDGYNFVIKKSKQGDYSTYSVGSRFKNKPTALTPDELAVVEESMIDLVTLLPQDPGEEKMEEMLRAALTGAEYTGSSSEDSEDGEEAAPVVAAKKPAPAKVVKEEAAPVVAAKTTTVDEDDENDADADAILAQIRARRTNKA